TACPARQGKATGFFRRGGPCREEEPKKSRLFAGFLFFLRCALFLQRLLRFLLFLLLLVHALAHAGVLGWVKEKRRAARSGLCAAARAFQGDARRLRRWRGLQWRMPAIPPA